MRWLLNIVAGILALLGFLWILQGTNIVRSGFMAGHMPYAILGIAVLVVAIALLVFANRRPRGTSRTSG